MRAATTLFLALATFVASADSPSDEFKLRLEDRKIYNFDPVLEPLNVWALYGSYEAPPSRQSEISVHLYPNKRFTVMSHSCDMCVENFFASGSYALSNGVVSFDYDRTRQGIDDKLLPKHLAAFHGWISEKGTITGSEYILIFPEDVQAARRSFRFDGYLRRTLWYFDWQEHYEQQVPKE